LLSRVKACEVQAANLRSLGIGIPDAQSIDLAWGISQLISERGGTFWGMGPFGFLGWISAVCQACDGATPATGARGCECQIQCQIWGFEGIAGDDIPLIISNVLISFGLPPGSNPSLSAKFPRKTNKILKLRLLES
jgi:hypothetical protein